MHIEFSKKDTLKRWFGVSDADFDVVWTDDQGMRTYVVTCPAVSELSEQVSGIVNDVDWPIDYHGDSHALFDIVADEGERLKVMDLGDIRKVNKESHIDFLINQGAKVYNLFGFVFEGNNPLPSYCFRILPKVSRWV